MPSRSEPYNDDVTDAFVARVHAADHAKHLAKDEAALIRMINQMRKHLPDLAEDVARRRVLDLLDAVISGAQH